MQFWVEIKDDGPYVMVHKLWLIIWYTSVQKRKTQTRTRYWRCEQSRVFKLVKQKLYTISKWEQISSFFFIFSLLVSRFFFISKEKEKFGDIKRIFAEKTQIAYNMQDSSNITLNSHAACDMLYWICIRMWNSIDWFMEIRPKIESDPVSFNYLGTKQMIDYFKISPCGLPYMVSP